MLNEICVTYNKILSKCKFFDKDILNNIMKKYKYENSIKMMKGLSNYYNHIAELEDKDEYAMLFNKYKLDVNDTVVHDIDWDGLYKEGVRR